MERLFLYTLIIVCFVSCTKDSNKSSTQQPAVIKVAINDSIYNSLKKHLTEFTLQQTSKSMIDSVLKYYTLNEESRDKDNYKTFPFSVDDDKLYYCFLDSLQHLKLKDVNKFIIFLNLDLITISNAEWGEGLNETIETFWHKPTLKFIEAIAALNDTNLIRINSTVPEGRDTISAIIKRIEAMPNSNKNDNKKVKIYLQKLAGEEE